ncbi:MAG: excinuclease ABC subunit UvrC [Clostridiales bacterium]|nr:excinuclease ABC subunit UvrC [Clostridiales bacterium]
MNERIKKLRAKAMALPATPGVYMMRDSSQTIIYVGKAKALKNRVSQYFGSPKNHPEKVRRMVEQVQEFEYILTDSEFEALVLECSLIKQYTPKYNILLKDDKGYHYIKVTAGEWPRIQQAKQKLDDGGTYIGPYTSSLSVKQSVDEARKVFLLPTCNRKFPQEMGKKRPCLNFYIKQCSAPCRGKITQKEYMEQVKDALDFLRGGSAASLKDLARRMEEAAENLEFEKAARLRDRIAAIKTIGDKQKVVAARVREQDIIALAQGPQGSCFEVFRFTEGRLSDREDFLLGDTGDPKEARMEFLQQYYAMRNVPPCVTLDGPTASAETLAQWLSEKAGRKVKLTVPQKGEQAQLTQMCRNNAAEKLAQTTGRTGKEASALDELARLLGLAQPPGYIEAYDISNLAGSENVAGMVVFENGRPLKSAYRKFKIKGFEGQDDYGSMREVLSRRLEEYRKNKESGQGFGRLPDLILLDGGKGHVAAVRPVLEAYGMEIPLFGMVKDDKHRTRAIAKDGGEIAINSNRQAFTLVSLIQDEVHRFAIGYHRQSRKKRTIASSLVTIEGIGPTRAKALLKYFQTVRRIGEASLEELISAPSMNRTAAEKVYAHFHPQED